MIDPAIEYGLVKRSLIVTVHWSKEQIERADCVVLHGISALRVELVPVSPKPQGKLLIRRRGMAILNLDQIKGRPFSVLIAKPKPGAEVLFKQRLGQVDRHGL
jgi:hypothetical protein